MTYTHSLTRIDENMQEEMDAQLLRECRLGAAKVGTIHVPHIATLNDIYVSSYYYVYYM
jgi:hypothetical protein